jgi:acyl-CoA thioesterase
LDAIVLAMIERNATADCSRLRPLDRDLLGLEPHPDDPGALSLVVVPSLCRTDGRFYGGAAIAAALAASEAATGRPALWSTTQLVAIADLDERIRIDTEIVASGKTVDQVQVRGTVGDRLIFNAVGAAATARDGGLDGTGQVMPRVTPPEDSESLHDRMAGAAGGDLVKGRVGGNRQELAVGHHLISEHRFADFLDPTPERPGRMAVWSRLTGALSEGPPRMTPAAIAFLADLVPLAVSAAAGVAGAGTSLDNTLRVGEPIDSEWVLLDVDADVAVGGYGHGHVRIWSPDGHIVAVGSQSARMFSFDEFARHLSR